MPGDPTYPPKYEETEEGPLTSADLAGAGAITEQHAPAEGYVNPNAEPSRARQEEAIDATLKTADNVQEIKEGMGGISASDREQRDRDDSENLKLIREKLDKAA